ncbi:MAG: MMPL family transporter [Thermoleophilia bacterium]|nr:MMPL family transporter [Thermoleophilia bacterium]
MILISYVLLMRAFLSVLLPLKAVLLNLVSSPPPSGSSSSSSRRGTAPRRSGTCRRPTRSSPGSRFLYGLSMDYEVFMLTRMREAYDETKDTATAISLGLARTGKLVTSAALVLTFAFFVLSTSPGTDMKPFGIGLAAGIIFDATVIRASLVPAIMRLMGRWNWWLPPRLARLLRTRETPLPQLESAA